MCCIFSVKIWPLDVEGPRNLTVPEGQTVKFRCRVLNDPEATIRWLKRKPISTDILNKKKPNVGRVRSAWHTCVWKH